MVDSAEGANAFTGERPGWGEGFEYDYARHIAAYRIAETLIAGRTVLDAGCGEGFGTQLLAVRAASVTGVDYSADAIRECRRLWTAGRPNLRFEQLDLTNAAAFSERYDVVLCFQVIEHIREPEPFVRALSERLARRGTLVLTTPNRLRSVSENPYHVREYTAAELDAELRRVFSDVTIRGIYGNDKVEEFEEGRRRAVRRILRLDPLGIRNLLPRRVVEIAFARLARVVRRRARPQNAPRIVPEDFSTHDESSTPSAQFEAHAAKPRPIDQALDLLAICRAPG